MNPWSFYPNFCVTIFSLKIGPLPDFLMVYDDCSKEQLSETFLKGLVGILRVMLSLRWNNGWDEGVIWECIKLSRWWPFCLYDLSHGISGSNVYMRMCFQHPAKSFLPVISEIFQEVSWKCWDNPHPLPHRIAPVAKCPLLFVFPFSLSQESLSLPRGPNFQTNICSSSTRTPSTPLFLFREGSLLCLRQDPCHDNSM